MIIPLALHLYEKELAGVGVCRRGYVTKLQMSEWQIHLAGLAATRE